MEKLKRYVPVGLWCGVIFVLSSIPSTPAPETWWNFLLKKGAHVTEYAILYWLAWRANNGKRKMEVPGTSRKFPELPYAGPLLFTILYAITDEIHQSFVPGRHARWYDIGFDTFGALLALWFIRRRKNQS